MVAALKHGEVEAVEAVEASEGDVVALVRALAVSQPQTRALVDKASERARDHLRPPGARSRRGRGRAARSWGEARRSRRAVRRHGHRVRHAGFPCFRAGAVPVLIDPGS